jgi:hypothetical protein
MPLVQEKEADLSTHTRVGGFAILAPQYIYIKFNILIINT